MKRLYFLTLCMFAALFFSSCVKNADGFIDFSTIQPTLELKTAVTAANGSADYVNIAGLGYFGNAALSSLPSTFPNDTISFYVNLASEYALDHDITVKVGIDADALARYNSDTASGGLQYELMPDSCYSWTDQTVTIPAGQHVALVSFISFNYDKIDPSINYMLPIGILDGDGITISQNQGDIYFHAIGNPLAGPSLWDFSRWDNGDPTSGTFRDDLSFTGESTVFSPVDATTVEVASGYYIQPRYVISFDLVDGVYSNVEVVLNQDDVDAMAAAGVVVTDGPNVLISDPANKHFKFQYAVSSGTATRYIIDEYYQ